MKIYSSKEILEMDELYELQDTFLSGGCPFQYEMTDGEIEYLSFVRGRYCIADWIDKNLDGTILTFDSPFSLSKAINDDGMPNKAVMLSDDTALQKLIFWLSDDEL